MARALLLDIDGVLTVSWQPLTGAADTLSWLDANQIAFRLVTNTSSRSRNQIARGLAAGGLPVDPSRILTAVSSAARYLCDRYPGAPCFVVNEGPLDDDLDGVACTGPEDAQVVLLGGAGPSIDYRTLDDVFRLADAGVPVVALHRNTRFQTAHGPALDMGAFVIGLEAAADVEVTIVGKPAPAFFHAALDDLGVTAERAVVVGDDVVADVLGGQAVGMTGVLVRTGKFRPSDLGGDGPGPDHVIDSIADLPDLLGSLG